MTSTLATLTIAFPDAMPNMALTDNTQRTRHRFANNSEIKTEREAWFWRFKQYAMQTPYRQWFEAHRGPYRIRWTVSYRDRRVRDWDNLTACFKPAQDALVDAGFLSADDARVLRGGGVDVLLGQAETGTVLTFEAISA